MWLRLWHRLDAHLGDRDSPGIIAYLIILGVLLMCVWGIIVGVPPSSIVPCPSQPNAPCLARPMQAP
jgi:hypothetical protein